MAKKAAKAKKTKKKPLVSKRTVKDLTAKDLAEVSGGRAVDLSTAPGKGNKS